MYRATSPIFDVPEFPTLRRVKPLPKRRRTSIPTTMPDLDQVAGNPSFLASALEGLQLPGPDASAEELLAHAETLSARMALQSYYMTGGVPDFLNRTNDDSKNGNGYGNAKINGNGNGVSANDPRIPANLGAGYGAGREEEDEHEDGDYIDHLQQPGNTKKRKVPANASNSFRGMHDPGSTDGQEEPTERGIPTGRSEYEVAEAYTPPFTISMLSHRKGKLSAATLAGLQHKEMLKTRKRQLAAVLGALSHGDTLALDQALSANYPFVGSGFDDLKSGELPKVRFSRRRAVRMARATRRHPRHPDQLPFPVCSFSFVCTSATADRLIATKEEVIMLRNRFEAELTRQATKAAKMAAASRLMSSVPAKGGKAKRADRAQQKTRAITSGKGGEQAADPSDQSLMGVKARGGKKKKRSALANASNPHHLRNYVPSRLPSSTQTGAPNQQNVNSQNLLGPLPLRFLSAEIPPRRGKKASGVQPISQLTNPAEEWICAFCEYSLFYGDDQEYRRAVRNRKKILRRRRRARERAAAAASGTSTIKATAKDDLVNDDYDALFEPEAFSPDLPKQTKWKGDPHKDRERGDQASYG